ncbi:hypothetical protein GEV27_04100 [Aeromicrobium sp. S22]|uniref:hypothetical protein n=1 Tax=Aeromicrobium sp. S22 TaxID=2662029 RepID=UPI00129E5907|nr:hypothetical protein [Aeromicrobium sp. S22]MRK00698.1 hypothetical protein [Aeromicrobium sp. S22]
MKKLLLALSVLALAAAGLVLPRSSADAEGALVAPVISGTGRVGETLTIKSLGSLEGDSGGYTYVWLWDGEQVPGPGDTGPEHTVTPEDVGQRLSVLVRPYDESREPLRSNEIVATKRGLAAPGVRVSGTAAVKRTLTATFTSPGTEGASVISSWTRDGLDILGASGQTYLLTTEDAGRSIAFRTTSVKDDAPELETSTAALRIPAYAGSRPTVSGTFKVGKKVKIKSRGAWSGAGYRYTTFRWLRNGKPISGATKSTYKLTKKDRRKRVSVRVTGTKKGFASVAAVSASTKVS